MLRLKSLCFLLLLLMLIMACTASATVQKLDLFLGLDGFETTADYAFQAAYAGGDYDWAGSCAWVSPPSSSGWRHGYNLCKPDHTVAKGWMLVTSSIVNPERDVICRLVDGEGTAGSKAQYVALRNCTGSSYVILRRARKLYPTLPNEPRSGDSLVFHVDSIRMKGFDSALAARAHPVLRLTLYYGNDSRVYQMPISVQSTSFSAEVSAGVRSGITEVEAEYRLDMDGSIEGKELGTYIDGAHLFIKRVGVTSKFATWEIPAPRLRSINTMLKYYDPSLHDVYVTAQSFDCILTGDANAAYIDQFKAINPAVKVLAYKTALITRNDDEFPGKDPWFTNTGVQYNYAVNTYPEWFYSGPGGYANVSAYPRSYMAHIENAGYQNAWAASVIAKDKLYGFDGVFIDDLNDRTEDGAHLDTAKCQQFLHAVMLQLRSAGISVQRNGIMSLTRTDSQAEQSMGLILNNPFFAPTQLFPTSAGYTSNSPYNVSDSYFQEWAFYRLAYGGSGYSSNVYDKDLWWGQIQDMDLIRTWNKVNLLPSGLTKQMVMHSYGVNRAEDRAYGPDGWMQFALASYLLAQNEYTWFGTMDRADYSILMTDYSITKKLGAPADTHRAVNGDTYCRYRRYQATADGGMGGVVVVNANPDVSRTYKLDFDALDELGASVRRGTVITLKPHTGRIFLEHNNDIFVSISASTQEASPGETVVLTVTCTNNGDSSARNVALCAKVPDTMTYVAGSAAGGTYDPSDRTVKWTIASLPAHSKEVKTMSAKVN